MTIYDTYDWTFKAREFKGFTGLRIQLEISHNNGGMSATINLGGRDRAALIQALAAGDPAGRQAVKDATQSLRKHRHARAALEKRRAAAK